MSEQVLHETPAALAAVPRNYDEAVRVLAAAHAAGADRIDIYLIRDPAERVVRLVEVSDAFPAGAVDRRASTGGTERIVPVFPMGQAGDFPFRSEIVQVQSTEWEQLRRGTLKLNRDWGDLNRAETVPHGN